MKIFQTFSAVVLIRGVAAGSFPMMSPVPKPPFKNETEHTTAKTIVTTITSDYSFYCPEPSTFHHKNVTYTATEPTYLTITNCPCTVTYTQNIKSPGTAVYPTAPPGQPMPPTPPVMSSSAPAPPLPPDKPAPPPSEYSAPISGPPQPPPKVTAPYSAPSLPPAIPKSTAASPPVNPTGIIEASVPSAAANKVSGSFGAFVLAGVAALAM
ncbi:hypothetical protein FoTM2_003663 [Fusarium oxysporum f. sp. vasinfectum]|nr:hypothetical protein FoTM2_003663 [Fusarium oxysporum f. sp. vasinfectum]